MCLWAGLALVTTSTIRSIMELEEPSQETAYSYEHEPAKDAECHESEYNNDHEPEKKTEDRNDQETSSSESEVTKRRRNRGQKRISILVLISAPMCHAC